MKPKSIVRKPRNPFVAAALKRRAGAHRIGTGGQRRAEQRAVRRELDRQRQHSP